VTSPNVVQLPTVPLADVQWREWGDVSKYVNDKWDPKNTPHHSIIGLTGSGKSYLAINGILKGMCRMDRVVLLDTKGDDELVSTTGRAVRELPRETWYREMTRKPEPFDSWWRVVVHETDRAKAQQQVYDVLTRIYREGNYVVFVDELFDLTAPKAPALNLGPQVETIYRKGRSRGVSLIASTQAPRYVPTSFYDQASFAWIGRLRDEDKQKRLLEIGGLSKKELPHVATLQRRQWLLSADNGEYFAKTSVK
jgi:DNA helicase HerA-like ATPase